MKKNENVPLATEIIHILAKIIVLLILGWTATIGAFIWYVNQPVEDTIYTQDADTEGENSPISQDIGE